MSKHRKGFTTLELVIVIGILMVLMGLTVIGFGVVEKRGKTSETKRGLETARNMMTELEMAAGLDRVKEIYLPAGYDRPVMADPVPANRDSWWAYLFSTRANYMRAGVVQQAMNGVASNRRILESLPSSRIARIYQNPQNQQNSASIIVLLDGWDRPIIHVPAGGLRVWVKSDPSRAKIQTSVGIIDGGPNVVAPPGARGFFASAGPDGDFSKGDDNLYSFEN